MESLLRHDDHDHDHDHDHEHDDTSGVVVAKGVAMATLFCASMICGIIPLFLARRFRWISADDAGNLKSKNKVVMTLLSFGGGVLLSTTFLHLLPEVDHNIEDLQCKYLFIHILSPYVLTTLREVMNGNSKANICTRYNDND